MSLKRSHADNKVPRRGGSDDLSGAKIDRQDLWDELQKRAATDEPFAPQDIATAIGASEPGVAKFLHNLALERIIEKVDSGHFRAGPIVNAKQADFIKALAARVDPKRQQDLVEIERLKRNNDEMRRRLLEAVAERDRYLALLRKHGIDPDEPAEPAASA